MWLQMTPENSSWQGHFQKKQSYYTVRQKRCFFGCLNSMKFVERYHGPLMQAFTIINSEAPELDDEETLKLTVEAINDSDDPDGLVPSLLVYGALSRLGMSTGNPTPSMTQRSLLYKKRRQKWQKIFLVHRFREQSNLETGRTPEILRTLQSTHQH